MYYIHEQRLAKLTCHNFLQCSYNFAFYCVFCSKSILLYICGSEILKSELHILSTLTQRLLVAMEPLTEILKSELHTLSTLTQRLLVPMEPLTELQI